MFHRWWDERATGDRPAREVCSGALWPPWCLLSVSCVDSVSQSHRLSINLKLPYIRGNACVILRFLVEFLRTPVKLCKTAIHHLP